MTRIHLKRLQQIIREELKRNLTEADTDHNKAALAHGVAANKLLGEIKKYKEVATSKVMGELQSELDKVEQILNRVVTSPLSYADALPKGPATDEEVDAAVTSAPEDGDVGAKPDVPKKKNIKPNVVR